MKRRNFLILSTTGLVALGSSYWYFLHSDEGYYNSLYYPEVLAGIYDTKTIVDIGMTYRQQFPDEDNEEKLKELISLETSKEVNNRKALGTAVKKDFKSKKTVIMQGWIISITEARQCALLSIINSK